MAAAEPQRADAAGEQSDGVLLGSFPFGLAGFDSTYFYAFSKPTDELGVGAAPSPRVYRSTGPGDLSAYGGSGGQHYLVHGGAVYFGQRTDNRTELVRQQVVDGATEHVAWLPRNTERAFFLAEEVYVPSTEVAESRFDMWKLPLPWSVRIWHDTCNEIGTCCLFATSARMARVRRVAT